MLENCFRSLARWIHSRSWLVVALWVLAIAGASFGSSRVSSVLLEGSGVIRGSQSLQVDQRLTAEFQNPFTKSLQVTFVSKSRFANDPGFAGLVRECARRLEKVPGVRGVLSYDQTHDPHLLRADRHAEILVIGMAAKSVGEEEALLPRIRQAISGQRQDGIAVAVTGRSAITDDVNLFNAHDSSRAEGRAIPLTLLVLLVAFGSLVAAGIPLAMGLASITVTLGVVYFLGLRLELSNLIQNVATMLGLAVGIDYSLLLVSRYRENLSASLAGPAALESTLAAAGKVIFFSGLTVMIGMAGLFFSPIMETQSVGIGGMLVVLVSMAGSLTLVPAFLALVGRHVDFPPRMARAISRPRIARAWRTWAELVMSKPWRFVLACMLLLGALICPVSRYEPGFPSAKWLPASMESRQGLDVLATMNLGWSVFPIYIIASAGSGAHTVLDRGSLGGLLELSRRLHADRRIHVVYSPVDLKVGLSTGAYRVLYANPALALAAYPQVGELFLSRNRRSALFQVLLADRVSVAEAKRFVRQVASWNLPGGVSLAVGGQPVYYNDYDRAMARSAPRVVGIVVMATFIALLLAFRSLLIPIKAIVMNLLSVGAGYGVMVAVIGQGFAGSAVGLSAPVGAIPQAILLMIFCIVFGLSMDYEVILLSRVKEAFDASGDNRASVGEGLARSGSIITNAALIMVLVFGAFAWAQMVLVKMMGLGLAVAVLVDATLIRCLAVPAIMRLAGNWNWWPGGRATGRAREPSVNCLFP